MFGLGIPTRNDARRVRLALSMLLHDKRRLCLSLTGVAFAVFLMFIQMGFLNGVYDSQTNLLSLMDADLIMIRRLKDEVHPAAPFPKERLAATLKFPEVATAVPIYLRERNVLRNPQTGRVEPILLLAFDPDESALLLPDMKSLKPLLRRPDTALIDEKSRDFYGELRKGGVTELNGRRIDIAGTFTLGPNFRADGNLLMSDRNFRRYGSDPGDPTPATDRVEFGLLKLRDGARSEAVLARLAAALPPDVRVVSKEEFIRQVRRFWAANQPVGTVFGLGMIVGFVIGVAICYQILFTDISNHQAEFATLKAIGYDNPYLVKIVMQEGLLLGLFGFLPGLLASWQLFSTLENMTGILMRLTSARIALIFALTLAMCLTSAAIAIRKVLSADPAEVF